MIRKLTGTIADIDLKTITLDVHGVGYLLSVSQTTLSELGNINDNLSLFTYLAVRDTALDLYGFTNKDGLEFFQMLLTINGVGPKSALGILDSAPIDTIKEGIASGDPSYLTKVSGIGKKSAEKIILQLKDKIGTIESESDAHTENGGMAIEALIQLGYSERDSRETIRKIDKNLETEAMLKEALKLLS